MLLALGQKKCSLKSAFFPCLTSSGYPCPHLGAIAGSVAFCNTPNQCTARATIQLLRLARSAVAWLLSQGWLSICILWNWPSTECVGEEEQRAWTHGGFWRSSVCSWWPAFLVLRFTASYTQVEMVTGKWSQSIHFVLVVFGVGFFVFFFFFKLCVIQSILWNCNIYIYKNTFSKAFEDFSLQQFKVAIIQTINQLSNSLHNSQFQREKKKGYKTLVRMTAIKISINNIYFYM